MDTITVTIPATPIKLSDAVQVDPAQIAAASWPGMISGVLRNLTSEASRACIARMHKEFAEGKWEGFTFVADTKANREAGKTPTDADTATALRKAWREANPSVYDAWMGEEEVAIRQSLYDGTFRVREAGEPRIASRSPLEQMAFDLGRGEFDRILTDSGTKVPVTKAGGPLPVGHKNLSGITIPVKGGERLPYKDALPRYLAKHATRLADQAKKELERRAKAQAQHAQNAAAELADL